MKLTGIVVEYNPFHNGHKYHIQQALELTKPDGLIAVMSGNFVQRGEVAMIDKWQRVEMALQNGVDLVVELPYIYATQSASQFAYGAITTLKMCQIQHLVFGSESNDLTTLKEIANLNIKPDYLKEQMVDGSSYPKSISILQGSYGANDILGICYLKELLGTNIQAHCIQRTNNYHDLDISQSIASASAIRHAVYYQIEVKHTTDQSFQHPIFMDSFYSYLRLLLLTLPKEYLQSIFLVQEGIENHLYRQALLYDNYQDFITHAITRRYTKARIQRTCLAILNQITKQQVQQLEPLNHIRVLGFNKKGQTILKHLKQLGIPICTRFKDIPKDYRDLEFKTTLTYASILPKEIQEDLIQKEIGHIVIK